MDVIPAGFQYIEEIPPDIAVKAFPIEAPRASAPIFRNCADVVPVLDMLSVLSNCEKPMLEIKRVYKVICFI